MAFTQAQLDALEEAIGQGATRVKYADKEVEYRSLSEMLRLRDVLRRALGLIDGTASRLYPETSKGLKGE